MSARLFLLRRLRRSESEKNKRRRRLLRNATMQCCMPKRRKKLNGERNRKKCRWSKNIRLRSWSVVSLRNASRLKNTSKDSQSSVRKRLSRVRLIEMLG